MENSAELRAQFAEKVDSYPQFRLHYIDECGIDKFLYREYAYSPRGASVVGKISGKKFKRTNIVAAKCGGAIVAPMVYDGTTDSALFEYWFEHALLKAAPEHSVFILDNAAFHRKAQLRALAEKAECEVLFLPPYSLDLNPIQKFWAWLKRKSRDVLPDYDSFDLALSACFRFN